MYTYICGYMLRYNSLTQTLTALDSTSMVKHHPLFLKWQCIYTYQTMERETIASACYSSIQRCRPSFVKCLHFSPCMSLKVYATGCRQKVNTCMDIGPKYITFDLILISCKFDTKRWIWNQVRCTALCKSLQWMDKACQKSINRESWKMQQRPKSGD